MAVLDAPGADDLDVAVVAPQREIEAIDAVAAADLFEQAGGVVGERGRLVEVLIDLIEEVGRCRCIIG